MASGSRFVIYGAIFGNGAIAISKFVAAAFTGSSAMIAEGIHSVVDTANNGLLLLGVHRSEKAPDARHPFGYGKELYFWALIVAITIFGVGGGMSMYEGIIHLIHPAHITDPTWNYVVLSLAMVFEGITWVIAFREFQHHIQPGEGFWEAFQRSKDPSVYTVLFEDTAAMLGLIVALVGVFLGHVLENPYFDGAASVVIGIILAVVACFLAYETRALLVGESIGEKKIDGIHALVLQDPGVRDAERPLSMQLGPHEALLNLAIRFQPDLSMKDLEETIDRIEGRIQKEHPDVKRIFIEAEGVREASSKPGTQDPR